MAVRFGKFFVDERIAIGGMAEVFRAHTSSGRQVAIKKILPGNLSQPRFTQMFLDEARIISSLSHPNIVQLLDFGRIEDTYFIAMEWVDGKPLSAVVRVQMEAGVRFPVDVALLITADICEGLAHAHSRKDRFNRPLGIVHRDVSPPNILLSRDAVAKLTDFGIAAAREKGIQTQPGIIRGKFSYMSPEQSRGEDLDQRSDLFGMGVVLYELLTSSRLFLRPTDIETIQAVRACKVPPLSSIRLDVPPDVARIVHRALAPSPRGRCTTAEAMAGELRAVLAKRYPSTDRSQLATFLKGLFPSEEFAGAAPDAEARLMTWKEGNTDRRGVPAPGGHWAEMAYAHRYALSLVLSLLAILAAELLSR